MLDKPEREEERRKTGVGKRERRGEREGKTGLQMEVRNRGKERVRNGIYY